METTPRHNNHTKHVSLEDIKREAHLDKTRYDLETAERAGIFFKQALNPLEDMHKYAKASGEYADRGDDWNPEDPNDGIDGAAELSDIAMDRLHNATVEEIKRDKIDWKDGVVDYMRNEANRLKLKSQLNPELFAAVPEGDESPLVTRVDNLEVSLKEELNQLSASDEDESKRRLLNRQIEQASSFKADYISGVGVTPDVVRNYVAGKKSVDLLEANGTALSDEQRMTQESEQAAFDMQYQRNRRDMAVYQLILQQDRKAESAAPEAEANVEKPALSETMQRLTEAQATLRGQLSELDARREGRVSGIDDMANSRIGGNAAEYRRVKAEYVRANQTLMAHQLREKLHNGDITSMEQINLFIAEQTVAQGVAFDEEKIEHLKTKDGRLAKAINFIAGRTSDGEKDQSRRNKIVRRGIKISAAGALIAMSVATGGAATAVAAGAWTALNVYAPLNAKDRAKRVNRQPGLLSQEEIQAALANTPKEIFDEASGEIINIEKDPNRTIQAKLDIASRTLERAAEQDVRKQQKKRLGRVAVSGIIGGAVGTLSYAIGGGFNGDTASAAPTPSGTEVAPPAPDASNVADVAANFGPNNVYVDPNDGLFNVFQQMNIPQDQWSGLLDKVGPELVSHGDAYIMPNGDPGLTHAGQLSQSAFETIMRAR